MTEQVFFLNVFFEKDPHLNAVERQISSFLVVKLSNISHL